MAKPMVTVTIELIRRHASLREHSIRVTIMLSTVEARFADRATVLRLARESLEGFAPEKDESDRRGFSELSVSHQKRGVAESVVVGIEGTVVWPRRPSDEQIERLRATLVGGEYRVAIRERRECAEPGCAIDAPVDWHQASSVPPTWFSSRLCGRHGYRSCSGCASTYLLTSTNCDGQGPSVHCQVCGLILMEWGSTKVWQAELVTRGPPVS
jgi:hypothetical protein